MKTISKIIATAVLALSTVSAANALDIEVGGTNVEIDGIEVAVTQEELAQYVATQSAIAAAEAAAAVGVSAEIAARSASEAAARSAEFANIANVEAVLAPVEADLNSGIFTAEQAAEAVTQALRNAGHVAVNAHTNSVEDIVSQIAGIDSYVVDGTPEQYAAIDAALDAHLEAANAASDAAQLAAADAANAAVAAASEAIDSSNFEAAIDAGVDIPDSVVEELEAAAERDAIEKAKAMEACGCNDPNPM